MEGASAQSTEASLSSNMSQPQNNIVYQTNPYDSNVAAAPQPITFQQNPIVHSQPAVYYQQQVYIYLIPTKKEDLLKITRIDMLKNRLLFA